MKAPVATHTSVPWAGPLTTRTVSGSPSASVADVLLELDTTHEHFLNVAATVPADRFQPGKTAWKIVDQNSGHHYREHGEQIRAWRSTRGI